MRVAIGLLAVAALLAVPAAAFAGNTWDGGGDGTSWGNVNNWTGDTLPASGYDVNLGSTTLFSPITANFTTGNSLTLNSGFYVRVGYVKGSNSTLNVNGGTMSIASGFTLGGAQTNGAETAGGQGTLNFSGGTYTGGGFSIGNASGATGLLDYSGGSITTTSFSLAYGETLTSATGTAKIRNGATLHIDAASARTCYINGGNAPSGSRNGQLLLGDAGGPGNIDMVNATSTVTINMGKNINPATNGPAILKGYGTVAVSTITASGSGRIIASSMGAAGNKTLDLSSTPTITFGNTDQYNYSTSGVSAQDHARIKFAPRSIGTSASAQGPGANTSQNYSRFSGGGVWMALAANAVTTAGQIQAYTYAKDWAGLPLSAAEVASNNINEVFRLDKLGGLDFTSTRLYVGYDDNVAPPSGFGYADLNLYWYNAATNVWDEIAGTVVTSGMRQFQSADTTAGRLAASKFGTGDADATYFALAYAAPTSVPEPATMALLVLGGLGVLARRRR